MKKDKNIYESPLVEVVRIEVEKGFAASQPVDVDQLPDWIPGTEF